MGETGRRPAASKRPASASAKSIILFSDGTGNSSAKLFKTNVWRLYEAVDLGPSPSGHRDQISFYDDGVGTSNFKFLAALGGAFGWGLKRNVLELYRFACRNYRPGDRIYAFGFSRGAFTIRLAVALITSQGLVQSRDESELHRRSREAYRAFRSTFHLRKLRNAAQTARRARSSAAALADPVGKNSYRREDNLDPTIRFVGVWDTVAAYGGPIAEITRAIDNWIYPLSMPDYELDAKVECARHALAIDDERDAFHPLLWDELAEDRRADQAMAAQQAARAKAKAARSEASRKRHLAEAETWANRETFFRTRLQQVWFTGMHADVGGGYPDESLSYVSLLWMMEEAEKAGLRTLVSIKDRLFALANSYGPMHDSRSGIGAYYRYQPRKIAAWFESPGDEDSSRYLILRDPDIRDTDGRARGLLRCVCVHESVIARINSGIVRYAPIALPRSFRVVPPQKEGEKIEQPDTANELKCKYDRPPSEPLIAPETRTLIEQEAPNRFACQENLWDLVWWRRLAYFATVFVTTLLVALPLFNPLPSFVDEICSDSRCVLPSLIRPLKALVPGFLEPWIEAMASYPVTPFVLGLGIAILLWWSGLLERRLWDRSYHLWRRVLDGQSIPDCPETGLRAFREGPTYQNFVRTVKWSVLPAVFGLLMVFVLLYVPAVAITQTVIQFNEANHAFCKPDDPRKLKRFTRESFIFDASGPCVAPNLILEKGQVYDVVFQLPTETTGEVVRWADASVRAEPGALTRVPASTLAQIVGVPMRRVIEASYLQPLVQTEDVARGDDFGQVRISKLNLRRDEEWPELYRTRIRAKRTSILHMFANDVHLPFAGTWFYDNNCGTARVTITKIVPRQRGIPRQELITEPGERVPAPPCAKMQTAEPGREDPVAFAD